MRNHDRKRRNNESIGLNNERLSGEAIGYSQRRRSVAVSDPRLWTAVCQEGSIRR